MAEKSPHLSFVYLDDRSKTKKIPKASTQKRDL